MNFVKAVAIVLVVVTADYLFLRHVATDAVDRYLECANPFPFHVSRRDGSEGCVSVLSIESAVEYLNENVRAPVEKVLLRLREVVPEASSGKLDILKSIQASLESSVNSLDKAFYDQQGFEAPLESIEKKAITRCYSKVPAVASLENSMDPIGNTRVGPFIRAWGALSNAVKRFYWGLSLLTYAAVLAPIAAIVVVLEVALHFLL